LFILTSLHPPISTLFPTRRSSDLEKKSQSPPVGNFRFEVRLHSERHRRSGRRVFGPARSAHPAVHEAEARHETPAGPFPIGAERSEEHTSELQSRSDLVCRLLLEK